MDSMQLLRAVMALIFTLSLIGLVAWVVQRYGRNLPRWAQAHQTGRLQVIERKMIDQKHVMVLLKCDAGEQWVLLSSHAAPQILPLCKETPCAPV